MSANRASEGEVSSAGSPRPELLIEPSGAIPVLDVSMQLAILVERSLNARRESAASQRDASDRAQEAAEGAEVASMREEARDTFKQALVSCAISVTASTMQMVAAGVQLRGADVETKAASFTGSTRNWFLGEAKRAEGCGKVFTAGATISESLSRGADGVLGAEVKRDQADAKAHGNAASRAGRESQRASDSDRELGELATRTLARLEELLQGNHQTQLALIQKA